MALVTQGFRLVTQMKDTGGNLTTRSYQMTAADYATAQTDAVDIITKLKAVSDAAVSGYHIQEVFVENAFALPGAAEVENQALLTLPIAGKPNKSASVSIPAPNVGIMAGLTGPNFNVVDFTDTNLIAFVNLFITGGKAKLSDGEVVVLTNGRGKRVHARSNRG